MTIWMEAIAGKKADRPCDVSGQFLAPKSGVNTVNGTKETTINESIDFVHFTGGISETELTNFEMMN